jgi:hypothetical protein
MVVDQSWPVPQAPLASAAGQYASGHSAAVLQYPASNGSHAHVPSFVNRVPVGHATAQVFSLSHAAERERASDAAITAIAAITQGATLARKELRIN